MSASRFTKILMAGCICFLLCFSMSACNESDETDSHPSGAYFQNHPLPIGKGRLRLLAIGNSFTDDALYFVCNMLGNLGVDADTYSVYIAAHEAASLKQWPDVVNNESMLNLYYCGGKRMDVETGTLKQLLAQPWDVVVLTQYSGDAINYKTFNPWLHYMIDAIQQYCLNPEVTLVWQMAWSYNDTHVTTYSNYERWSLIAHATQQMMQNDGIDVLIPVGTAIQNARNTALNSESQLTRDGWHLNEGVGRYIAACTVIQSLFAPVYGISILDNSLQLDLPETSSQLYPPEPVTDENRSLCHQCVLNAILQPFKVVM